MDIRVENLQAVLGGTQILRGVELQVGQRELVGVIGPNGSGKSTLLKCIYRVLKPSGGAVYLDGKDLEDYSFKQSARRVAVVAQHNYYNFDFTVQDVVLMGRAPHKRALERDNARDYQLVAQALETVGMAAFAGRSFSTLSGGEQQRVILARALAQDTPCLILDEPTNHLDVFAMEALGKLLMDYAGTLLLVSHDRAFVEKLCGRLVIFEHQRLTGFEGGLSAYYAAQNKPRLDEREKKARIDALEMRLAALAAKLAKPGKKDDPVKLDAEYKEAARELRGLKG